MVRIISFIDLERAFFSDGQTFAEGKNN